MKDDRRDMGMNGASLIDFVDEIADGRMAYFFIRAVILDELRIAAVRAGERTSDAPHGVVSEPVVSNVGISVDRNVSFAGLVEPFIPAVVKKRQRAHFIARHERQERIPDDGLFAIARVTKPPIARPRKILSILEVFKKRFERELSFSGTNRIRMLDGVLRDDDRMNAAPDDV